LFWSLSPCYGTAGAVGSFAYTLSINSGHFDLSVKDSYSFRPTISLKSTINVTTKEDTITYGQPGTVNNPYVIE